MQDILEFEKKYKGSDEERQDVIRLYMQHQGDMDAITASALCCTQEDEPRICSIIQAAIDSREVEAFPAFTREGEKKKKARRKRVRNVLVLKQKHPHSSQIVIILIWVLWLRLAFQADKERKEAEEMQKELGLGDQDDSLVMMLQVTNTHAKFESREGFVGHTSCLQPSWHSHFPATTEVQRAEF